MIPYMSNHTGDEVETLDAVKRDPTVMLLTC